MQLGEKSLQTHASKTPIKGLNASRVIWFWQRNNLTCRLAASGRAKPAALAPGPPIGSFAWVRSRRVVGTARFPCHLFALDAFTLRANDGGDFRYLAAAQEGTLWNRLRLSEDSSPSLPLMWRAIAE